MKTGAYRQLAAKAYKQLTRYRSAHMINNVASVIFGFIYISIWQSAGGGPSDAAMVTETMAARAPVGDVYTPSTMVHYVAFSQVTVWITIFLEAGLGIPAAVRTGSIAWEMLRPLDYHAYVMSRTAGSLLYNALFRSAPMAFVFAITVGMYAPTTVMTWVWLGLALFIAAYVACCLHYVSGIVAFWTVNAGWSRQILVTLHMSLSGFLVPVDLLPGALSPVARLLPFASLHDVPGRLYLELAGADILLLPVLWAVILTVVCRYLTAAARRRLEVQGG